MYITVRTLFDKWYLNSIAGNQSVATIELWFSGMSLCYYRKYFNWFAKPNDSLILYSQFYRIWLYVFIYLS